MEIMLTVAGLWALLFAIRIVFFLFFIVIELFFIYDTGGRYAAV